MKINKLIPDKPITMGDLKPGDLYTFTQIWDGVLLAHLRFCVANTGTHVYIYHCGHAKLHCYAAPFDTYTKYELVNTP